MADNTESYSDTSSVKSSNGPLNKGRHYNVIPEAPHSVSLVLVEFK